MLDILSHLIRTTIASLTNTTFARATVPATVAVVLMANSFAPTTLTEGSESDSYHAEDPTRTAASNTSSHRDSLAEVPCLECTSGQQCDDPEFRDWAYCYIFEFDDDMWCNHGSSDGHECQPFALAPIRPPEEEYVYSTAPAAYALSEGERLVGRCLSPDSAPTVSAEATSP